MFKFLLKQYKIFMDDFDSKNIKNLMQLRKLKGMRILKIVSDARKSGETKIINFALIESLIENLFMKRSYEYSSLNCI
jgi:hypothetical protein